MSELDLEAIATKTMLARAILQSESGLDPSPLSSVCRALNDTDALIAEVRRLKQYIQEMVEIAADNKLDGYRELGSRAASAEAERDALLVEVRRLQGVVEQQSRLLTISTDTTRGLLDKREALRAEVQRLKQTLEYFTSQGEDPEEL
jgi:hypothetical protein